MYFNVNLAFLDHLEDLTETVIDTPIDRNWTHKKHPLLISLESFEINSSLIQAPKNLKITSNNIRNTVRNCIYTKTMITQTQKLKPSFPAS